MIDDLHFSSTQFGWAAGILFIGYCFFEIPSNLALYRFGARRWLARIMVTWGLASAATAFVVGPNSFYAARLVLGIAEAGYFPGVVYMIAIWFPAESRARMLAIFTAAVPLSSVVGGPFSALLLQLDGILGLKGWQWMFLIQGLPACVIGVYALAVLRDTLSEAYWLSSGEQAALRSMLEDERSAHVSMSLWDALLDKRILLLAAIQFGFVVGSYGIGIWLPLILKGRGLSTLVVGFASAIPYGVATIAMLAWARSVDRNGKGVGNLVACCALAASGLVVSVLTGSFLLSMSGLTAALVGATTARAIFWTLPPRVLSGKASAGGIAFVNVFGALGGFVGPYLVGWLKDHTGSFSAGLIAIAGLSALSAVLTVLVGRTMRGMAKC
jgi:ACS family tartrate transporter-like MFS transporter